MSFQTLQFSPGPFEGALIQLHEVILVLALVLFDWRFHNQLGTISPPGAPCQLGGLPLSFGRGFPESGAWNLPRGPLVTAL